MMNLELNQMNVGLTADVGVLVTPLINALLDTIRTDIQND